MRFSVMVMLSSCLLGSFAFSTPSTFSYQGRLFDDNGDPLLSGNAAIVLQILDPTGNCLLFEESHNVLMDNSGGYFRVSVGLGTKNTSTAPNFALTSVFSNQSAFTGPNMGCGPTYTPAANHHRLMRVKINGETLAPDHTITAAPFALQAGDSQKLEGKSYTDIKNYSDKNFAGSALPDLQVSPLTAGDSFQWDGSKWITTQAAPKDLPSNSVTLDDVAFASTNGIAVPSLNSAPGSPTAGQIYFNSVSNKIFFYNGTTWVDTADSAGGDFLADGSVAMTGNINLGGRYVSGDGGNEGVYVDNDGDVGIGTNSPAAKLQVNGEVIVGDSGASCAGLYEGALRYNSTTKKMQFCNGTSWSDVDTDTGITSESDPQVAAVTSGKWCRGTGSTVTCDQNAPTGGGSCTWHNQSTGNGGDITYNVLCPSGKHMRGMKVRYWNYYGGSAADGTYITSIYCCAN